MNCAHWSKAWNDMSAKKFDGNLESRLRKLEEAGCDVDLLRGQLHRIMITSPGAIDAPQLEDDLVRLRDWE
jgi:hypothetical protein